MIVYWKQGPMLFNFRLTPLDRVATWSRPETDEKTISWFGLTDGEYWIEAGDQTLLAYSDAIRALLDGPACCDYFVARLYEDLCEMLPWILEPIPSGLLPYVFGGKADEWRELYGRWYETDGRMEADEDRFWTIAEATEAVRYGRYLDTYYLSPGANISIWSDADSVYLGWDNSNKLRESIPVWTATRGVHRLSRDLFVSEARSFDERLMYAMEKRIGQVLNGALPSHIAIDLDQLQKEHTIRSSGIESELAGPLVPTDWTKVLGAIAEVEREMKAYGC